MTTIEFVLLMKNESKLLEKSLKDAIKSQKCIVGTKQVSKSIKDSKLIVISESISKNLTDKIEQNAKKEKIPTLKFQGTSVALGKLCGLQFRVSLIAITSLSDANINSILKDSDTE